jgi:hypothetical protein
MDPKQKYFARGNLNVENKTESPPEVSPAKYYGTLLLAISFGFILCLQLVQAVMLFLLFSRVDRLESEIENLIQESNSSIIQYLDKK